ncbi:uncharacterized protein EV420DRAFT_1578200 [Desarmillaria tabescens]|uniref:F-box domain-containing protein n=1 Tax=Armillaria tabescens TaxID=1929756 RepID=A0AA39MQ33_ARMTA|nr:uncharacterized protein EV420DRAFT_1578200 [Desarmillaria tabescens]KAK0442487.1 hypothetical protein EV420DRAFT_1578200 [Desarmillaria tabescens]
MSSVGPINRVPPELLTEIFLWFSDITHDISRAGESPWTLTHVCQLWRDMSLRTPSLWSSFSYTKSTKSPLNLITTQIARSKREPLSFHVDFACDTLISIEVLLQETMGLCVFDILMAEADRWKDVTLLIPDDALGMFMDILSASQEEFPLLQTINIYRRRVITTEVIIIPDPMFVEAPVLSSVRLFPFIDLGLPWTRLTEIETSHLPVEVEFTIITESPLLRKLVTTHRYGREDLAVADTTPVVHAALRVFGPMYTTILPHLVLPSLTELVVDIFVDRDPPNALSDFISRSGSSVRHFSLHVHLLSSVTTLPADFAQKLVGIFSQMHALVDLDVDFDFTSLLERERDLAPIFFDTLQGGQLVLQKLERINVKAKRCICSLEDIVALVQYRWVKALVEGGNVTRLRRINVECDGLKKMFKDDALDCLDNLRRFKTEGLEFSVVINGVSFDWESYIVGPPRFDSLEASDISDTEFVD